jgi:hypothetical protein
MDWRVLSVAKEPLDYGAAQEDQALSYAVHPRVATSTLPRSKSNLKSQGIASRHAPSLW